MRVTFTRAELPRWTPENYRQRPNDCDFTLADQICQRVANGEVLAEICNSRDMPLPATFLKWTRDDPTLDKCWRQAQLDRLDVFTEECVLIADTSDPKQAAMSISSRSWMAERLNPKKFSQRTVAVGVTGDDDTSAGIDYGREVRRKIDEMAARRREEETVVPAA